MTRCPWCNSVIEKLDGTQLRAIRHMAHWTLREAADWAGASYTYLSKVENGHMAVSVRLSEAFKKVRERLRRANRHK